MHSYIACRLISGSLVDSKSHKRSICVCLDPTMCTQPDPELGTQRCSLDIHLTRGRKAGHLPSAALASGKEEQYKVEDEKLLRQKFQTTFMSGPFEKRWC